MDELSPINPGASVLVVDGPFAGLEGMVSSVSARRIDVLMQLLGTAAKVSLDRNSLEVIG
jgi:transcription antitermination factor NusG